MSDRLGDGPIEPKHKEMMNNLARGLDGVLNGSDKGKDRKIGFVLLTFEFGTHEGRCNYISNADRKNVVMLLKEQLKRFEGQPDMKGHA